MRLKVDFGDLWKSVIRMGAEPVDVDLIVDRTAEELRRGVKLDSGAAKVVIDSNVGLWTYRGRHAVLYIQDQGERVTDVINDGATGKRVHLTDCDTLAEMKEAGKFDRYVVSRRPDGEFVVTGVDETGDSVSGTAQLRVCQNCLRGINNGLAVKWQWHPFEWDAFFADHDPVFAELPSGQAGLGQASYTPDWEAVSRGYRKLRGFRCEGCQVDLSYPADRRLLHVHHQNGMKGDNRWSNLRALCAVCHGMEPGHDGMRVSKEDADRIRKLKEDQGPPG